MKHSTLSLLAACLFTAPTFALVDEKLSGLEPLSWKGREFPLAAEITGGDRLKTGKWTVLLFHHDCPLCVERIEELRASQGKSKRRILCVELSPYGKTRPRAEGNIEFSKLSDRRDWALTTPVEIEIEGGKVTRVVSDGSARGKVKKTSAKKGSLTCDLGYVKLGSLHEITYEIENPGKDPLKLLRVRPECGCTKILQAPDLIAAGKSGVVRALFEAFKRPTDYKKGILIKTKSGKSLRLLIKARIGLPLRAEIVKPESEAKGSRKIIVRVHNGGDTPVKLLYATSKSKGIKVAVPQEAIKAGGHVDVPVTLPAESQGGERIDIRTTCVGQRRIQVDLQSSSSAEHSLERRGRTK